MSHDEIVRTMAYIIIIPGVAYVGVRVWNAVIMPQQLRKPVAIFLWLQGIIYAFFMVGLFILRILHTSSANLLYINTFFILAQAASVLWVALQLSRLRRMNILFLFLVTFVLLGGFWL